MIAIGTSTLRLNSPARRRAPSVHPVDAQQDGGAAGAVPAQQLDDGAIGRARPRPLAAAAVDRQPRRRSHADREVGGADVLAHGEPRVLERDEPAVDDRIDLSQHALDPLARVDRLGDEGQVGGDVREALGVDPPPDPEALDAAVQRRDLQPVALEAVHQRVAGQPPAHPQRLAEVDVELQTRADHLIAWPRCQASAARPRPSSSERNRLASSSSHVPDLAEPLALDHPGRERRVAAEEPGAEHEQRPMRDRGADQQPERERRRSG